MAELSSKVYDFKTFIDEFPLPQVVKVMEGIYGNEDELTLPVLEVIQLLLIKNCETVKATDDRNREFFIPLNSPAKVRVLPNPVYQELYVDVKKLAQDFPTYVQAFDDDLELDIAMGDILKLKEVNMNPHDEDYLKCECTSKDKQDILVPFSCEARFRTLGDFGDSILFLKEVVANTPDFPIRVKFEDSVLKTRRQDINGGYPTGLNQLGTFILKEAFVMKLVVASMCKAEHGSERTLLTIPHNLNIKVTPVLDKSEPNAYLPYRQTEKHCQDTTFKINFNEASFRYGCNVIENQGNVSRKQGNGKKPIPRSRNRVTPVVTTASSSGIYDVEQTVNNSCDLSRSSSCPDDETQKEVTRVDDFEEEEEEVGIMSSHTDVEEAESGYVDMSFCKEVISKPNLVGKHESLTQLPDKNYEARAAATSTTATLATTTAAFDAAANGGGDGDGSDSDDSKDEHIATTNFSPSSVNTSREIDDYAIPVTLWSSLPQKNQAALPPGSIVESPRDDTDDDVFQGGHGHLGLPPPVPERSRRLRNTRSASLDTELHFEDEKNEEQHMCMTGEVGVDDTNVHLDEGRKHGKKTRRILSDLWPSISSDSTSSSTSFPVYDVPPTSPQAITKKTKSKIRRNFKKLTKKISKSGLKRSKSTSDMSCSEDYHYVEAVPAVKADKQTDIAKALSHFHKPKKKGSKDLSPVDCLSTFTVDEVSESLKSLNLGRYVENFRANTVDGSLLMDLNDKMLDELKVTSELDRLKIRKLQKEGWTPKYH